MRPTSTPATRPLPLVRPDAGRGGPRSRSASPGSVLSVPVVLVLVLVGIVGCGAQDRAGGPGDDAARDRTGATGSASPGDTEPSSPDAGTPSTDAGTPSPADQEPGEVVAILTETAVGGTVDPRATPLPDESAGREFARQFSERRMRDRIAQVLARADVPADRALYAAVVAVGCDIPTGVVVTADAGVVRVVAQEVASTQQECFAPMTSVALVVAPASS